MARILGGKRDALRQWNHHRTRPAAAAAFYRDLATGVTLWKTEPRSLDLEFDITNVGNSIYQIAKESEEIPIQYAPVTHGGRQLEISF